MASSAVRTVTVRLTSDVASYVTGVGKDAVKATTGLNDEIQKLGKTHTDAFNKMTLKTAAVGSVLLGAFGAIVKSTADFDKEMSAVSAVMDTTGQSAQQQATGLQSLRTAAIQAGKDTVFSATEAATAEEELAKAGVSTADILGGALTGSLSLASAGSLDLADAATVAAQAMNIWGLGGQAVTHVADVLAAGSNKSAADVKQLGDAMKQGGLVAANTGLSFEDTIGTLSAFADHALVGSDAGTSLKTMLQALQKPAPETAALMKQLGINVYDASGKFIGITGVAQQLHDQLGKLSQKERDNALATIFGSDATRSATVLYQLGAKGIQNYIDAVDDSGAAAETARKKMDNLHGDVEQLKGSFETLAIVSGGGANNGLRVLTQTATGAVNVLLGLPKPLQESVTIMLGVSGAGLLAATGFVKARQSGLEFMTTLRDMGPKGAAAATGLSKLGSVASKAGLAIGAIGVALIAADLISHLDGFAAKSRIVSRDVDAMTDSIEKFSKTGQVSGELEAAFGKNLDDLHRQIEAVDELQSRISTAQKINKGVSGAILGANGVGAAQLAGAYDTQKGQIDENLGASDKSLAGLVNGGNATAASASVDKLAQAAGMSVDDLMKRLPEYTKAIDGASFANSQLAQGFGTVEQNTGTMILGLQDAIDHGQSLDDVFKQLHGTAEGFARGEIGFQQSIDDLSKALADNGHTLDINSQKGRDNKSAILDTVDAAEKAAQAKFDESGSVQQASDTYNAYISQLKNTLHQAHFTDAEINTLIGTYASMPPAVNTQVNAKGVDGSAYKVEHLKQQMLDINGKTYTATVRVVTHGDVTRVQGQLNAMRRWGGVRYAADGLTNLSGANLYSGGSPLYGFAEQGTGGEAFVPRLGDPSRSMSILDTAESWYGRVAYPAGGGGGGSWAGSGAPVFNIPPQAAPSVRVYVGNDEITSRVRVVVDQRISDYDHATAMAVAGGVRH